MNKTIYIFDDDAAILDIFVLVFESSGYNVHVSNNSNDILSKLENVTPDIIIMDNWIPDIGGIEATKLIKNHPNFKHIPVIYCSANSDIVALTERAGAQAHLSKPFDLNNLEDLVSRLLSA